MGRLRALIFTGSIAVGCGMSCWVNGARASSPFDAAIATYEQTEPFGLWSAALAIDGNTSGLWDNAHPNAWSILNNNSPIPPDLTPAPQSAYFRLAAPMPLTTPTAGIQISLNQMFQPIDPNSGSTAFHTIGDFRLSVTTASLHASTFNVANASADTWIPLNPSSFLITVPSGPVPGFSVDGTDAILISTPGPALATYTLTAAPGIMNITGIRLEVLPNASLPFNGPGFNPTDGNFALIEIGAQVVPEPATLTILMIGGVAMLVRRRRMI